MNCLPTDFDLSSIVGEKLGQICIDEFQIQLRFDSGDIQGGGSVTLENGSDRNEIFHEVWKSSAGLEALIGSRVDSWEKRGDFEFALHFDSGRTLVFRSRESQVEDFTINLFNKAFWVL